MSICKICGEEFLRSSLSSEECGKCKMFNRFKSDMEYYMRRVDYIKERYNFTTEEALNLLRIQILDDRLYDIDSSISKVYDVVRDIN